MPGCKRQTFLLSARVGAHSNSSTQARRSFHRSQRCQARGRVEAEHAALTDTSSLSNTLESIREANRTRLIRKGHGQSWQTLSLPRILQLPERQVSHDVVAIERAEAEHRAGRKLRSARGVKRPKGFPQTSLLYRQKPQLTLRRSRQDGQAIPIADEYTTSEVLSDASLKPWMAYLTRAEGGQQISALDRLSREIRAFTAFITPTPEEEDAARAAIGDVQALINTIKGVKTEVVGSRSSGLASPMSDIDINLSLHEQERFDPEQDRMKSLTLLRKVVKAVSKYNRTSKRRHTFAATNFRATARVPIVSLMHMPTGLPIEIQASNGAFNGLAYAKSFQRDYPQVRSIFLLLKHTLRLRQLNQGPLGGLTSYPLLNMIVASCQSLDTRSEPVDAELAHYLLEFLDFYSSLPTAKQGVCVLPFHTFALDEAEGVEFRKRVKKRNAPTLWMKDPADPANNLGKAFNRLEDFQATMGGLSRGLAERMQLWDARNESSSIVDGNTANDMSILEPLVTADWRSYHWDRMELRNWKGF